MAASDRARAPLADTAFAILGHLALRPWSAYELARSVGRSMRWFWSRADSRIYSQVRRLEALGLAESVHAGPRARPRTVYSITPAGRRALADWLATPGRRFTMHLEPLLRVHLARHGSRGDLLRALDEARDLAHEMQHVARDVATEFIEGRHALQDEAHVRALVFDFLWDFAGLLERWADRSEAEVQAWTGLEAGDAAIARALASMRRAVDAVEPPPG